MPAHTRASVTSLSASENRSKLRVVQDLLLKALKPILSVPKKFWSVCTNAAVAQACPEGWSGNDHRPLLGNYLFWCEGSDDFFKARVAPQRIPKWQQLQLTIGDAARGTDGDRKLFAGEIFVANPRGDHR